MITLRLEKKLEDALTNYAKKKGLSKSEVIRKSLKKFFYQEADQEVSKIEENLFGRYGSKNANLSMDAEKILRERFKKNK